jgi:hypothetical protein
MELHLLLESAKVIFRMVTQKFLTPVPRTNAIFFFALNRNNKTMPNLKTTTTKTAIFSATFAPQKTFSVGYSPNGMIYPNSVSVADVNGDGKPDLITANSSVFNSNYSYSISVLLGDGKGSFAAPTTITANSSISSVADVNGDGKTDLVTPNPYYYQNGNISVLMGDGKGNFAAPTTVVAGMDHITSVSVTDVNGDGEPDLITATSSDYDYIRHGYNYSISILIK